ncbi:hypothetical protein BASA50_002712 [Batrachochytrium salamandrivorans]|uniref:Uncharacterized protein n=1 Tax=Batrachochytrium salamandrivorans TaxID=1357716 RepID=A0ABQ8FLV2_9FUNG|nr:hypothetical protein BASA62_008359 [Batrachochytrium salamandrivorans]KAH6575566.1 hypothetical protein BASA60_004975 [Batrachochytrium salamandrivorans]KAH6592525.1 hypothetical protein BASA61_004522 [Batrachochytrium salamandrivorans]KAH6599883.1 hypothetical protein BASA50_002712 [Batrachochytrium salamandrivorans]KAH9270556.1 hypothetical protein BASA83_007369 [Batrachochytrium salamandrivorans]
MLHQLTDWIIRVAALNDSDLEEELKLINKNSLNAFTRALSRIRRPELDSHTYRNGTFEAHPDADTINLLLSIGETAISAINSEIPVSPVPWAVSPHMDINTRIKVLTRRIIIYKSELPTNNRANGPMPKYLQIRQFIGQDLFALEDCFSNQNDFSEYTKQAFKWDYAICHLYIGYYRFLIDYPVFVYSKLPWTRIRNECTRWRRWLDSDEARSLPTSDFTSSSFWKGILPPYRENENESEPSESPSSFHSFEDDADDEVEVAATGSEMVISTSLGNLNI